MRESKKGIAEAEQPKPVMSAGLRRTRRLTIWFGYVLPLSVYALAVLFAPVDIFDRIPRLKIWADGVQRILLTLSKSDIYKHAQSTEFPQVAMLTSSLAIFIATFVALATSAHGMLNFKETAPLMRGTYQSSKDRIGKLTVLPLLGLFCMWSFFCLKGDPSFAAGYTTQSRGGYLFISSIAILLAGFGIGLFPFHFRLLISEIFSGGKT
jgi:hypothetical protein